MAMETKQIKLSQQLNEQELLLLFLVGLFAELAGMLTFEQLLTEQLRKF
jgi:hypothetical protein